METPRNMIIGCLLLCTAVLTVYGRAGTFAYLSWDDFYDIRDNPVVASGTTLDALSTVSYGNFAPAATISFQIERRIFGADAGEEHFVNVLLHVLNTLLIFFLLWKLVGDPWAALAAAMVFAVHPRSVEAVAWLSARKHLLAGTGIFAGLLAYMQLLKTKKTRWYGCIVPCCMLSILSTPAGALLPFGAFGIRYFHFRKKDMPWELFPLLPLSIAGAGIAAAVGGPATMSWGVRAVFAVKSVAAHVWAFIVPLPLSVLHPDTGMTAPMWIAICTVILIMISAVIMRRSHPALPGGLILFLLFLSPTLFVFEKKAGVMLFQDRYLYIAMIGLLWIIADCISRIAKKNDLIRIMTMIMISAVIIVFGFLANSRADHWHDNKAFYQAELAMHPDAPYLHLGLGYALQDEGDIKSAIVEYQSVLTAHPDNPLAKRLLEAAKNDSRRP